MAQILDRMTSMPDIAPKEHMPSGSQGETQRIQQLEKQVTDLTEKRLDYLEKIQHQQFEMQVNIGLV